MNINGFEITILEDGTVKVETGSFQGAVHLAADKLMSWIESQMGGETTRKRLGHAHDHDHDHEHGHDHKHTKG